MNRDLPVVGDAQMRAKVRALEAVIRQGPQTEIPVEHFFANRGTERGVYARQITIPPGTVLTGEIHKYEQINFLLKGDISVLTDEGVKRLQGPAVIVSPPGTKRAAYTHTEVQWVTVHATAHAEVDEIKQEVIAASESEYLEFCEALRLEGAQKCLG